MVEDNTPDKWGLRNLIPVLVVEVQKVCNIVITWSRLNDNGDLNTLGNHLTRLLLIIYLVNIVQSFTFRESSWLETS